MKNKSLDNKKINNKIMENNNLEDKILDNNNLEDKIIDNNQEEELDSQTRDLIKRIRSERSSLGIKNSFFVPEDKKEKNYIYQWSSTDKESPSNPNVMENNGWRKVDGWESIPTGGYTADGQPGKHYLMKIRKEVHKELELIQQELAQRQKKSISGRFKDGNLEMNVKQDLSGAQTFYQKN